jgi:hypothetical protein
MANPNTPSFPPELHEEIRQQFAEQLSTAAKTTGERTEWGHQITDLQGNTVIAIHATERSSAGTAYYDADTGKQINLDLH